MFTPFDGFTFFPAAMATVLTAWNLAVWPTDHQVGVIDRRVSILIPARNEARVIAATVQAALDACPPEGEVLVCDDASTDDTLRILGGFTDPRLRVLQAGPLPEGWVGKPHACHQLAQAASGEVLLFLDADVRLNPDALPRLLDLMRRYHAPVLTAFPRQQAGGWFEQLVLPFLPLSFVAWIPLDRVWRSPRPWLLAVCGQLLLFERSAYDSIGGHAAIRAELVDDMAICGNAKRAGHRVVFAEASRSATCRMYGSTREVWEGFSKNMFEGLGERWWALGAAVLLYLSAFVLPWVRAAVEWAVWGQVGWEAALAVAGNLLLRSLLALRLEHRLWSVLAHPIGAVAVVAMALNSARWTRRGAVAWRGRTYAPRAARQAPTAGGGR